MKQKSAWAIERDRKQRRHEMPLTKAQKKLIETYSLKWPQPYRVLITVWAALFKRAQEIGFDVEEIDQICWLGVIRAARDFDPDNNTSFATYASHKMRGTMKRAIEHLNRAMRKPTGAVVSLEEEWTRKDPEEPIDQETVQCVIAHLDLLSPREKLVIEGRYGLNNQPKLSLSQIGQTLKVSKERVRQIQKSAIESLRRRLVDQHL